MRWIGQLEQVFEGSRIRHGGDRSLFSGLRPDTVWASCPFCEERLEFKGTVATEFTTVGGAARELELTGQTRSEMRKFRVRHRDCRPRGRGTRGTQQRFPGL